MGKIICFIFGHKPWRDSVEHKHGLLAVSTKDNKTIKIEVCERCLKIYAVKE